MGKGVNDTHPCPATCVAQMSLPRNLANTVIGAGVVLTVVGITVVSIASLVWPEPSKGSSDSPGQNSLFHDFQDHRKSEGAVMGIALTLLSMLMLAGRLVAEELALRDSTMHPLQVLGFEGMWGNILVGISLPVVWRIPGSDIGEHIQSDIY